MEVSLASLVRLQELHLSVHRGHSFRGHEHPECCHQAASRYVWDSPRPARSWCSLCLNRCCVRLILGPARELAVQVLKVGKELVRGWHAGEGAHVGDNEEAEDTSKSQSLRWGLVVGGESMDEQFEMITSNPDV